MNRLYTLLLAITTCIIASHSQALHTTDAASDYNRGVMMYNDGNYIGCHDVMRALLRRDDAKQYYEEAAFLATMSLAQNAVERTPGLLNGYLHEYPHSLHRNEIYLALANYYYHTEQYELAVEHYSLIDINDIKRDEQDDMNYHLAFSYVKVGDTSRALPLFKSLAQTSSPYRNESRYYEGYIYYQNQDYKSARRAFKQVNSSSDFGIEAQFMLTHIDFLEQNYAATIASGTDLIDKCIQPKHRTSLYRIIGESHYQLGNDFLAEKFLDSYLNEAENPSPQTCYMAGILAYRNAKYDKAIALLEPISHTHDEVAQNATLHTGLAYLHLRNTHKAYNAFTRATVNGNDETIREVALYNQALCAYENNFSMFDSTLLLFENFLKEYPQSEYADDINTRISDLHISSHNYKTALQYIDRIKEPEVEVLRMRQQILYILGTEEFANNKINNAGQYFSEAIKMGNHAPEYRARSIYWLGECCYRKKAYQEALQCYQQFLGINITTDNTIATLAHYNEAYCFFEMKKYDKARTAFDRYVKLADKNAPLLIDANNRIGDCYFLDTQYTLALQYYEKAARKNGSGSDYALLQQALINGVSKNHAKKASLLLKLIDNYPKSEYCEEAYNELGQTYITLDNPSKAIETYNQLMQRYPKSPSARKALLQLGSLYYNRHEIDNSINAYTSLITQHPASNEARIAAEDLKSIYIELNRIDELSSFMQKQGVDYHHNELDSLTYLAAQRTYAGTGNTQPLENYVEKYPNGRYTADAAYYLGNVCDTQQQYDKALNYYLLSINRNPDSDYAENATARCCEIYNERNEYSLAAQHYNRLEQIASTLDARQSARLGALYCYVQLGQYNDIIGTANRLLANDKAPHDIKQEAMYQRATASIAVGDTTQALADYAQLAEDPRTPYGAEAAYLLAQHAFDNGELTIAEERSNLLIEKGSSQAYWVARIFILLADIYYAKGDTYLAQQYLTQLQQNYPGSNDDIAQRIEEKLKVMNP